MLTAISISVIMHCIINPRRMREGYGSRSVCVRACVCVYVESRMPLAFLCYSPRMYCVDFVENVLFKSSGEISVLITSAFFTSL